MDRGERGQRLASTRWRRFASWSRTRYLEPDHAHTETMIFRNMSSYYTKPRAPDQRQGPPAGGPLPPTRPLLGGRDLVIRSVARFVNRPPWDESWPEVQRRIVGGLGNMAPFGASDPSLAGYTAAARDAMVNRARVVFAADLAEVSAETRATLIETARRHFAAELLQGAVRRRLTVVPEPTSKSFSCQCDEPNDVETQTVVAVAAPVLDPFVDTVATCRPRPTNVQKHSFLNLVWKSFPEWTWGKAATQRIVAAEVKAAFINKSYDDEPEGDVVAKVTLSDAVMSTATGRGKSYHRAANRWHLRLQKLRELREELLFESAEIRRQRTPTNEVWVGIVARKIVQKRIDEKDIERRHGHWYKSALVEAFFIEDDDDTMLAALRGSLVTAY